MSIEEGAGSSPGWGQVCTYFGVPLISDEERGQVRAAQRPIRGAPVMEVHSVVGVVVQRARVSLNGVSLDEAPPEVEMFYEQLRLLFERTERELIAAYRRAVLPQRHGMFGNVMAHHDPSGTAPAGPRAYSLTCRHCGAPRLSDEDFECPYCGQNMANKEDFSS